MLCGGSLMRAHLTLFISTKPFSMKCIRFASLIAALMTLVRANGADLTRTRTGSRSGRSRAPSSQRQRTARPAACNRNRLDRPTARSPRLYAFSIREVRRIQFACALQPKSVIRPSNIRPPDIGHFPNNDRPGGSVHIDERNACPWSAFST